MKISQLIAHNLLSFFAVLLVLSPVYAAESNKVLHIVTTVPPITNMVENIGGANVNVVGIVPNGIDSHTFEPVPTDAKILADADIIIVNGLDLELPTIKLAEKVKKAQYPNYTFG